MSSSVPLLHRARPVGWLEALTRRVYRSGWSARLARLLLLQRVRVDTLEHDVAIQRWPRGLAPLRIAFGSDFHAGPTTHPRLLDLACGALANARPQLLLLGGDFIYLHAEAIGPLAHALGQVPAPLGRFAVLGNHDVWGSTRQPVTRALEAAGIEVLENRSVALPPPYDSVCVVGLDDPWLGRPDAQAAFRGAADLRILLMHSPSGLVLTGELPFDLGLCGHTHGGQIALPGGRAIHVPYGPLCRDYPHGRHALGPDGRRTLIVSRGIGTVMLPVRLFAPADILVCNLRGPEA